MAKQMCPNCGKPLDRMQRTDPRAGVRSIACAYPCNDWLTYDQAAAVRDRWRQQNGDTARDTATERTAAAA